MTDFLLFLAGVALLSSSIAYAWWMKVRVICLRDDLFEIRDRLWGEAARFSGHEDRAYKDARESINAIIRIAGTISLPIVFKVLRVSELNCREPRRSANAALQAAIDGARLDATNRLAYYLLFETLVGRLLQCVAALIPRSNRKERASQAVAQFVDSRASRAIPAMVAAT